MAQWKDNEDYKVWMDYSFPGKSIQVKSDGRRVTITDAKTGDVLQEAVPPTTRGPYEVHKDEAGGSVAIYIPKDKVTRLPGFSSDPTTTAAQAQHFSGGEMFSSGETFAFGPSYYSGIKKVQQANYDFMQTISNSGLGHMGPEKLRGQIKAAMNALNALDEALYVASRE